MVDHIPKAARSACGVLLISIFKEICRDWQDLKAWKDLLMFGQRVLKKPRRGEGKQILQKLSKREIAGFQLPEGDDPGIESVRRKSKAFDPDASLAAAVTSKMEEGNMRAAVRLLCSDERPAEFSDASLRALQAKHPLQATDRREFPPLESHSLSVDKSNVIEAIRSFPNGSGGGPDGFKPGVLKDLVNCRELSETFP